MFAADLCFVGGEYDLTMGPVAADGDLLHVVAEFDHLAGLCATLKMEFQRHGVTLDCCWPTKCGAVKENLLGPCGSRKQQRRRPRGGRGQSTRLSRSITKYRKLITVSVRHSLTGKVCPYSQASRGDWPIGAGD